MSPLPAVSGSDLSSVELPGDGVEALMASRLDVLNYRQHVGGKLCCLRFAGRRHALDGAGGVPSRFSRALAAARAALVPSLGSRRVYSPSIDATAAAS
jgi:hypothetical protein